MCSSRQDRGCTHTISAILNQLNNLNNIAQDLQSDKTIIDASVDGKISQGFIPLHHLLLADVLEFQS
ncbi:rCG54595 [Rattus norvegicus]|uniref:RCG54595 n=1 Tax=Rattus norvegicus TaxID=10116 RepID=A6JBF1_RAT|nr:rCG54595 [Rattus norvegicus]